MDKLLAYGTFLKYNTLYVFNLDSNIKKKKQQHHHHHEICHTEDDIKKPFNKFVTHLPAI